MAAARAVSAAIRFFPKLGRFALAGKEPLFGGVAARLRLADFACQRFVRGAFLGEVGKGFLQPLHGKDAHRAGRFFKRLVAGRLLPTDFPPALLHARQPLFHPGQPLGGDPGFAGCCVVGRFGGVQMAARLFDGRGREGLGVRMLQRAAERAGAALHQIGPLAGHSGDPLLQGQVGAGVFQQHGLGFRLLERRLLFPAGSLNLAGELGLLVSEPRGFGGGGVPFLHRRAEFKKGVALLFEPGECGGDRSLRPVLPPFGQRGGGVPGLGGGGLFGGLGLDQRFPQRLKIRFGAGQRGGCLSKLAARHGLGGLQPGGNPLPGLRGSRLRFPGLEGLGGYAAFQGVERLQRREERHGKPVDPEALQRGDRLLGFRLQRGFLHGKIGLLAQAVAELEPESEPFGQSGPASLQPVETGGELRDLGRLGRAFLFGEQDDPPERLPARH